MNFLYSYFKKLMKSWNKLHEQQFKLKIHCRKCVISTEFTTVGTQTFLNIPVSVADEEQFLCAMVGIYFSETNQMIIPANVAKENFFAFKHVACGPNILAIVLYVSAQEESRGK